VFRIVSVSVGFTGGGVGLMLPLRESFGNLQFGSRKGYIVLVLGFVVAALLVTGWLRNSRFGARLQAVRDNEDAARAIGIDPWAVKLGAITLSAAFMGPAARSTCRYSSTSTRPSHSVRRARSRRWSPRSSAAWVRSGTRARRRGAAPVGRADPQPVRRLPGLNMIVYGVVLVLIVLFAPRGLSGVGRSVRDLLQGAAWLTPARLDGVSIAFGRVRAVSR
jgi:branched-chain amino acid transport system permease protein